MNNKEKYLNAYKELGILINNKSRDFKKMQELFTICIEGQDEGIPELQEVTK